MTEFRKLIDPAAFKENLGIFDNETIAEIIDIFISEYPGRIQSLEQAILNQDIEQTRFHAHSLKGVIANFGAPHPFMYIRKLEEMARQGEVAALQSDFEVFKPYGEQLVNELSEIRNHLSPEA